MAVMNEGIVTDAGRVLLALAMERGEKLNFTRMATTDHQYAPEELAPLATLAEIKQEGAVTLNEALSDGRLVAESLLLNAGLTEGYDVNTIGLYADLEGVPAVLFSVATAEVADHVPAYNERTPTGAYLRMYTALYNTENFTVSVDMAAIATTQMLEALKAWANSQLDNKANKADLAAGLAEKVGNDTFTAALAGKLGRTETAVSATALARPRYIRTNLGTSAAALFDGTADINPGVTGTLPLSSGGTGRTNGIAAANVLGGTFPAAMVAASLDVAGHAIRNIYFRDKNNAQVASCRIYMNRKV